LRKEMLASIKVDENEKDKKREGNNSTSTLSSSRLEDLFRSHCECSVDNIVEHESDGFEDEIKLTCAQCHNDFISKPESVVDHDGKDFFVRNVGYIYHSVIEGYGLEGLKRLQGILGNHPMGAYKYYRYFDFLIERMNDYFSQKQDEIHQAIRIYYLENTDNVIDANGDLNIDISYDGTWQKRGHTSLIGMGFIIEVNTGHIVDTLRSNTLPGWVGGDQEPFTNPRNTKV